MKKRTIHRMNTMALFLMFLIGLLLVIWPVATELSSYMEDDGEYDDLAAGFHAPEPSLVPAIPAATETAAPDDEQTEELASSTTVAPATEAPEVHPTASVISTEAATEQPIADCPIDLPVVTVSPTTAPTIIPLFNPTDVPASPVPQQESTPAPARPTQRPTQAPTGVDLDTCVRLNRDFVAWLTIPGTKIDYPVVRSNNTEYYLHHLFNGKESKLGCLFSLKSSNYELPSKNIAIYGHHLSNSTAMFSTLLKYKSQSYCDAHSVIQLNSLYGARDYRIFAVLNMNVSDWDAATVAFSSDAAFLRFVNQAREQAIVDTGIQVTGADHILTLITCDRSYGGASGRLIVMAVQE